VKIAVSQRSATFAISPDGKHIAVAQPTTVEVFSVH